MGWDCTLHVVDEASLSRFAARFLRGLHRDSAFDREFDGDDSVAKVKQLIADDPATGARALSELALLFVSTETPHLYCRSFAISLWDEKLLGAFPVKLLTSVESRIPDVMRAYPKLVGRLPTSFEDHFCVGPFVTARNVPALLAHVEQACADAIAYRPLVEILRIAAARNLGYWEGTDIDVTQAHAEWLPPHPPPTVVRNSFTSPMARPCAIEGTRMLIADHLQLHEIDTAVFPPTVLTHDDCQVHAAAFTPWGTQFLRIVADRTVQPFKFAYVELPDRTPVDIDPPFAIGLARPTKNGVLLFPQPTIREYANLRPHILYADHRLVPLAVAEPVESQRVECDAIPFNDREMLVIWDAVAYRWDGNGPPAMLGDTLDAPEDLCAAVTLSDGSIVGGFGHKLIRIERTGNPVAVLPLDTVMAVTRGPDDAIVISEGENADGDAYKIWWPATREITHVPFAVLGLDERPLFTYYDAVTNLLVAARPGMWHAIAWDELAALRRDTDIADSLASSGRKTS